MARQVKALVAKANDRNLILETHTIERDNWFPQDVL